MVESYARTQTFDESSIPDALRSRHRTKNGVFGRIVVESGHLILRRADGSTQRLGAGDIGVVRPQEEHDVTPDGPVRFHVEFVHADAVYDAMIEALRPLHVEFVEGETDQPLDGECARCGLPGQLRYRGTTVLEGDLEHRHVVHTEVEHQLACAGCSANWRVFKVL